MIDHVRLFGTRSAILTATSILFDRATEVLEQYDPAVLAEQEFDMLYGTNTAFDEVDEAIFNQHDWSQDNHPYAPVAVKVAEKVLRRLPVEPERFELFDIGVGKGRFALMAARLPFKRVIGIDLSEPLVDIARKNVERFQCHSHAQRCGELDIWLADALEFDMPRGNTIYFLFNPFVGEVFEAFIERVHHAVTLSREDGAAPEVYLVYLRPRCADVLESAGYFEKMVEYAPFDPRWNWSLWKHL